MSIIAIASVSVLVTNLVTQSVDSRLQGADPASGLSRFSNYAVNAALGRYKLNPKFWVRDVDFSAVSPWNSDRGRLKAGTLISKRHVIFAKHFPIAEGSRIVFVGEDGEVCPCRIVKTQIVPNSDIMIGALDYEVTPNIHPVKVFPADYEKYIGDGVGLPTVAFTQNEKAVVTEVRQIYTNETIKAFGTRQPEDSLRKRFNEKIIVGDSGDPVFMIVGNEPVLLYCLSGGGGGVGPSIHRRIAEVQRVMDELCSGYKLEEFDFSKIAGGGDGR